MKVILPLILLLNVITASDEISDTDDNEGMLGLKEAAQAYYDDPNPFVNCSRYFASRRRSINTTSSRTPIGFNKTAPIGLANSSLSAFEDDWCRNWAYTHYFDDLIQRNQVRPRFPNLNDSSKSFCLSLEVANYNSWAALSTSHRARTWKPVFTTPCCQPGCRFTASDLGLLWWPNRYTITPVHNVTTSVAPDGFIFTSPSVYVVYTGLSAIGECGTIGPTYARLTLPYLESDISAWASHEIGHYGIATPVNFADLFTNCTSRSPLRSRRDAPPSQVEYETTHCYPSIVFPKGLQKVESPWASCSDAYVVHDSAGLHFVDKLPLILTPAAALIPISTNDPNLQSPTPAQTATPAVHVLQPLASKTAPPTIPSATDGSAPQTSPPLPSKIASKNPSAEFQSGRKTPDENTMDPGSLDDTLVADPPGFYTVINPSAVFTARPKDEAGISGIYLQGHQISSAPAALIEMADGQTHTLPSPDPPAFSPVNNDLEVLSVTSVDGHKIQVPLSADVVLVDAQTIARGKSTTLGSGISVALHSNGDLVLGTSTVQRFLPLLASPAIHNTPAAFLTTTVDGHKIQIPPSGDFVLVDSQTIARGKSATLGSGISVALHSNGDLELGTSTVQRFLPLSASPAIHNTPAAFLTTTVDGHKIQVPLSGDFVLVDSQTIARGKSTTLGSGISAALHPNGDLVLGTSTIQGILPSSASLAVNNAPAAFFATTVDGHKIQVSPSGDFVLVDSQTITPGKDPVPVSGISAALHPNGDLVLGTSTVHHIFPPSASLAATLTVAGHIFTAVANGLAIDGETLTENGQPITISGTPISLAANALVVGTFTVPLPILAPHSMTTAASGSIPVLLILNPNIPATTIAENSISLGAGGLVVGSPTVPLVASQLASSIFVGGQSVPISQVADGVVVAGSTLRTGNPAITILGTPLALESSALVVGTSAIPIQNLALSTSPGIGDLIFSAINGGLRAPNVTESAGFGLAQNNSTENFVGGGNRLGLHPMVLALVTTTSLLAFF